MAELRRWRGRIRGGDQRGVVALPAQLSDVSTPSLYRQVATLVDAEVLEVTAERRIRAAVKRTYRLRLDNASVSPEHLAAMSVEEHRAAFMTFVAGLLADFDRCLAQGDIDLIRDGVGYRQTGFYATADEFD